MTEKTAKSMALIAEKLGFIPWGGCSVCPNLAYCTANEHELPTLPCELDDISAGVDLARLQPQSKQDMAKAA